MNSPEQPIPSRDPQIPSKQPPANPSVPERRTQPEFDPPGSPEVPPLHEPPNILPIPSEIPIQG